MSGVCFWMKRREWLLGCAAGASSLAFGWPRRANACGSAIDFDEEEVLELASGASEPARELAHFFVQGTNSTADHRFSISPAGDFLCFADRGAGEFRIESAGGETHHLPAPEGGSANFRADGRAIVLQLWTGSPYDQILVANPRTGESERWGDFLDAEPFVFAPGGLVVAHGRAGSAGALSWVTSAERTTELVRTPEVPKQIAVDGSRVAYFVGDTAFAVELAESSRAPQSLGRLSKPAIGSIWNAAGLVATNADGAWLMRSGHAPRLLLEEANPRAALAHRGTIALGSERRVWFSQGGGFRAVDAPHANFHFTGPIAGTDDFILCRGPSAFRYDVKTGQLERLGSGRPGMKLRGAALFGKRLLTWSSRTWATTDAGCSASPPPRSFVVN